MFSIAQLLARVRNHKPYLIRTTLPKTRPIHRRQVTPYAIVIVRTGHISAPVYSSQSCGCNKHDCIYTGNYARRNQASSRAMGGLMLFFSLSVLLCFLRTNSLQRCVQRSIVKRGRKKRIFFSFKEFLFSSASLLFLHFVNVL